MDEILRQAAGRTPELVVLVALSWLFLKALKESRDAALQALRDRRDANTLERKDFVERLTSLHSEHMAARLETRRVMERVAESMEKVAVAVAAFKP